MHRALSALALLLAAAGAPAAQPAGETLVQDLPPGYKIALSKRQGQMQVTEMIPQGEDLTHWSEMVTTQTFVGGIPGATPESFFQTIDIVWKKSCPRAEAKLLHSGEENGHPVAFWTMTCPWNGTSSKAEYTWFKAIQGKDNFYLVQKAWKSTPAENDVDKWTEYLRGIAVCDPRGSGSACPPVQPETASAQPAPPAARHPTRRTGLTLAARAVAKPGRRLPDKADARACLDYEDNAAVIRCAERYR